MQCIIGRYRFPQGFEYNNIKQIMYPLC